MEGSYIRALFDDSELDCSVPSPAYCVETDGQIQSGLVFAKSQVASPKMVSMPRLEFISSVVAAKTEKMLNW